MRIVFLVLILSCVSFANCVEEKSIAGFNLEQMSRSFEVRVLENQKYLNLKDIKINPFKLYTVQLLEKNKNINLKNNGDFSRYNKKYIEYYTYPRIKEYIKSKKVELNNINYQVTQIGKSLEGRDLYFIGPKKIDPEKKTIIMFGRHHGDEGTANWIIEGYLNKYLKLNQNEDFQLLLYPMINPDGAMAQSRYNINNRDLNRSWTNTSGFDEIFIIHRDLKSRLRGIKNIVIALDMHGSIREDFIYRVDKNYQGNYFYNMQSEFINQLGVYDSWQNKNFILSNGHPRMARMVLINHYQLHALTHETIKNIKKRNWNGRSKETLIEQGVAVAETIADLY